MMIEHDDDRATAVQPAKMSKNDSSKSLFTSDPLSENINSYVTIFHSNSKMTSFVSRY